MAGSRPSPVRRASRSRRAAALGAVTAAVLVLAACVPPVAPPPTVAPEEPGSGRVPGAGVVPSAGCTAPSPAALPAGRSTLVTEWDGVHRFTLVDVPTTPAAGPRPVLLSLHPFLLTPEAWESYSGLAAEAVARGYVVLTPLGSEPGPRWAVPGGLDSGVDDVGYLNSLLDVALDRSCIDRNRQFAAGFSAGAAMAQALSCTLPWRMAAVAGSGGTNLTDLCPDSPGTSVLVIHGTADPIAPITGSTVPFAPPVGLPVADVVATDAARAGCAPVPEVLTPFPTVEVERYTGCTEERRVEYWKLLGAGHTWAGRPSLIDLVGGPTNTDVAANDLVLDFFDAQAS